ncbi:MAG: hypothetical protein APR63_11940 [Desulfuromonas sp. SDB]|nr:MAG: hypothetical protein APR63_11940 [Desulfuromonas sp. SDB]
MNKQPIINQKIIFLGIIWGISEATLGYLIHLIPGINFLSGMIMFPIGFYMMVCGLKETNRISSIIVVSGIAAGIKLFDFIFPLALPLRIINPSVAILLESTAVVVAMKLIDVKNHSFNLSYAYLISFSWRILFLIFPSLPLVFISQGILLKPTPTILNFFVIEPIIEGFFIYLVYKFVKSHQFKISFKLNPRFSISVMLLAFYLSAKIVLSNFLPQ